MGFFDYFLIAMFGLILTDILNNINNGLKRIANALERNEK